jgi:hypothetical protein
VAEAQTFEPKQKHLKCALLLACGSESSMMKKRYFEWSDQAKRAGWTGRINTLCEPPFEDHVYVDFDLRPRQRRQRLREFMAIRDLEVVPGDVKVDGC